MTDKEVGELWREHSEDHYGLYCSTCQLIRKLVEERRERYKTYPAASDDLDQALRDFGIDPETWK